MLVVNRLYDTRPAIVHAAVPSASARGWDEANQRLGRRPHHRF